MEDKLRKWTKELMVLLRKAKADGVTFKVSGGKRSPYTVTADLKRSKRGLAPKDESESGGES